jgi:ABC-type Na+ efflux pump permease subunit
MRNGLILTKRELYDVFRTSAYWLTTGLIIIVVVAILLFMPWLQHRTTTAQWTVITPTVQDVETAAGSDKIRLQWVKSSQAAIILHVGPISLRRNTQILVQVQHGTPPTVQWFSETLVPILISARITETPHLTSLWGHIIQAPHITFRRAHKPTPAVPLAQTTLTYTLAVIIFMIFSIYGQVLVTSVSAEKANRVSELMLVRVSPAPILLGKWAGVGLAAFLQILTGLLTGVILTQMDPQAAQIVHHWGMTSASLMLWVTILVAFILGYAIYGSLFIMFGASLPRPEDARSAMGLPIFALMAAYGAIMVAISAPTQSLTHILTILPPFFPFLILIDQGCGAATAWEWILGSIFTSLSSIGLLLWAIHIYRKNILSNNRRYSLKSIMHNVRRSLIGKH